MKSGFHLLTAAGFTTLIGVVACGPQNVPQPQRMMGPGVIANPMLNQQAAMMNMNRNVPINTNLNTKLNPTPLPSPTPTPVPVTPKPAVESAEITRNFEFASSLESAHLIPLKNKTYRVMVNITGISSPYEAIISLDKNNVGKKPAADGISFALKEEKSQVRLRRLFRLTVTNSDRKEKAEVQFEIALAEFSFRNSEILVSKKGETEAKELSEKMKALSQTTGAIATISYSWILNPRIGLTANDTLVSGVDFVVTEGDKVLVGLSHIQLDVQDRVSSGDNVSMLASKGGNLLEKSTSIVMTERAKILSNVSRVMTLKVGFDEQILTLGFQESAKSGIRHMDPSIKN